MDHRSEALKKLPFYDALSAEQKEYAEQNSSLRRYSKNEYLVGNSSSCLGMIHIISGSVRVHIVSEDGREITLFRAGAADTCVLSAACVISQLTFETDMIATEDTEVLIINSGAVKKLSEENIHVRCFIYQISAERFSQVMFVMQQILFIRFDRRLAGYLLRCHEQTGDLRLQTTQEEIAQNINSAREVVARMLKQFASDGLIALSRGRIDIKDIEGLKALL